MDTEMWIQTGIIATSGWGRMAFNDNGGGLLAEDNVVKANLEDDLFQNKAAKRLIWWKEWRW